MHVPVATVHHILQLVISIEATYPPHEVSHRDNYIRAIDHLRELVHDGMAMVFAFDGRSSQNFKDAKDDARGEFFGLKDEMNTGEDDDNDGDGEDDGDDGETVPNENSQDGCSGKAEDSDMTMGDEKPASGNKA